MKCPFCGEEIQEDAVKCRYCMEWLSKPGESIQPTMTQRLDNDRLQQMSSTPAIKDRETWFSRYYKGILTIIIILPMLAAIAIPFYLVKHERTRKVQPQIKQEPAPAPVPAPVTEEPALPPGYETLILQADIPLGTPPANAVDIFFRYKPKGSKRYVTELLIRNVPVVSYSAAERQIEIHIPAEEAENLKNASNIGTVQVRPIR